MKIARFIATSTLAVFMATTAIAQDAPTAETVVAASTDGVESAANAALDPVPTALRIVSDAPETMTAPQRAAAELGSITRQTDG